MALMVFNTPNDPSSIATHVHGCLIAFQSACDSVTKAELRIIRKLPPGILNDELGRFKLWCGNVGAHRQRKGSLDYKLREASHIRNPVIELLQNLKSVLEEATEIITGKRVPWEDLSDSDTDGSEDGKDQYPEEQTPTELEQLASDMAGINTCLMRLSMAIRNPAPHDQFKQSVKIDTTHFEPFDVSHAQGKFPMAQEFLIVRLGKAISRRRQYLRYREEHRKRLEQGLKQESMLQNYSTQTVTAPSEKIESTVASSLPLAIKASTFTARLRPPPLPEQGQDGKPFECPLCFRFTSVRTVAAWHKHVYRDLQPYVCTVDGCEVADRTYESRHEWFHHELQVHRKWWECVDGCNQSFQSSDQFRAHLWSNHANLTNEERIDDLIRSCERYQSMTAKADCPLCQLQLPSLTLLRRHLGKHLEELSLFALPLHMNGDGEDSNDEGDDDDSRSLPTIAEDGTSLPPSPNASERREHIEQLSTSSPPSFSLASNLSTDPALDTVAYPMPEDPGDDGKSGPSTQLWSWVDHMPTSIYNVYVQGFLGSDLVQTTITFRENLITFQDLHSSDLRYIRGKDVMCCSTADAVNVEVTVCNIMDPGYLEHLAELVHLVLKPEDVAQVPKIRGLFELYILHRVAKEEGQRLSAENQLGSEAEFEAVLQGHFCLEDASESSSTIDERETNELPSHPRKRDRQEEKEKEAGFSGGEAPRVDMVSGDGIKEVEVPKETQLFGVHDSATWTSINNLALVLQDQGNYKEAEKLNREVLEGRERELGLHHPDTLTSVENLAMLLQYQGNYDKAEKLIRRALKAKEMVLGPEHPNTLTSVSNLRSMLSRQGKYDEAEAMHRRALEGLEKVFGQEHPKTLTSVSQLGSMLSRQGKYDEAEAMHRRALEGLEKVFGREHPKTLTSVSQLGSVLSRQGKYDEAEAMHRRALEGLEKVFGQEHPKTLTSVSQLGSVLSRQGKYDEAEAMHRRALEGLEKVFGREHPKTLTSVSQLGSVMSSKGKYEMAEAMHRRALEGLEKVFGREHPKTLISVSQLGSVLSSQGKYKMAEAMHRRALEGLEKELGPDHPY